MTVNHVHRTCRAAMALAMAAGVSPSGLSAQTVIVPLVADRWTTSDTLRIESHLGRPSLYFGRGIAIARDIDLRDGTIELDLAATARSNNMGLAFRVQSADAFEVMFFRPGASGTVDASQYAPAFNSIAAAWQIYHGDGANAVAALPRDQWLHLKIELAGDLATVFLNDSVKPLLRIPHLALGAIGGSIGVWTGAFGNGVYISNLRYTPSAGPPTAAASRPLPEGTINNWELSQAIDATALVPGRLPDAATLTWQKVAVEPEGFVLVNRYRRAPNITIPTDPKTREVLVDSVVHGRVAGSKVVFARAEYRSDRQQLKLMHVGYSDNVVIYCNGTPVFSGVNPAFFRGMGNFEPLGDAVYLPMKKGRNEIVFAVTEFFGGWAFSARLDR